MMISRRDFITSALKTVASALPYAAIGASPIAGDEFLTFLASRYPPDELSADTHFGVPEDVKGFSYTDTKTRKTISVYARTEDTFISIKDSLDFMKEQNPDKYTEVISGTQKIKEATRFNDEGAVMAALPGLNVIYVNAKYQKDFGKKEIGCIVYHEKLHIDGRGEIIAQILSDLCEK